jgi:1-acyl-sn-glycerol-3-phosphate acyltransferase
MKDRAFAEVAQALRNGEIIGIFPEGKLTNTGELNPFRPGIQQIVDTTPVPVVPLALRGLWGSFFSRSRDGKALRGLRGIFSRIALVAAPPVPPEQVTLEGLQATVLALRGERR